MAQCRRVGGPFVTVTEGDWKYYLRYLIDGIRVLS
jgi:hypothetical protein